MLLTMKAGADPADPRQIEVWCGTKKVENCTVESAYWSGKKLVLTVTIWEDKSGDHKQDDGAVRT